MRTRSVFTIYNEQGFVFVTIEVGDTIQYTTKGRKDNFFLQFLQFSNNFFFNISKSIGFPGKAIKRCLVVNISSFQEYFKFCKSVAYF